MCYTHDSLRLSQSSIVATVLGATWETKRLNNEQDTVGISGIVNGIATGKLEDPYPKCDGWTVCIHAHVHNT